MSDDNDKMNEEMNEARIEIVQIMTKHDLAGAFMLVNPDCVMRHTKLDASWSCASYDGEMARFEAGFEIFPINESQKKCIEETVGLIAGLSDVCRDLQEQLTGLLEHLSQRFEIRHRTRRL